MRTSSPHTLPQLQFKSENAPKICYIEMVHVPKSKVKKMAEALNAGLWLSQQTGNTQGHRLQLNCGGGAGDTGGFVALTGLPSPRLTMIPAESGGGGQLPERCDVRL
ncbi:unnamed protein product [Agarophyton chilense]